MTVRQIPSYAFNANAAGLGGVIKQGNRTTVIPTLASVSLASAGGEAEDSISYYDRDGISFTRAQVRAGGYTTHRHDGLHHSTFTEVLLLNLRIFDRISIARMQAVLTSKRDLVFGNPLAQLVPDRTEFWAKLLYHGVEIDGKEVDIDVDNELCESTTFKHFFDLMNRRNPKLVAETTTDAPAVADRSELVERERVKDWLQRQTLNAGLARIKNQKAQDDDNGHVVDVDDFGRARFGDIIVKPDRRRVSLLRLTLDADWKPRRGNGNGGDVLKKRVVQPASVTLADLSAPGGGGGSVTSGDNGSNGVPIWP
jgi:hypothetical protein